MHLSSFLVTGELFISRSTPSIMTTRSSRSRNCRDRTQRTLEISSPASPIHRAVRAVGRSADHPWAVIIKSGPSIIGPCYRTAPRDARCCSHATASPSDSEPLPDLARTSHLV
ncbi:hypothetical protein ACLOJK_023299 [Asimina triloba]